MTEAQSGDALSGLVRFMIWLAILGVILALIYYYGVVLPAQQGLLLHAPMNKPVPWPWGTGP